MSFWLKLLTIFVLLSGWSLPALTSNCAEPFGSSIGRTSRLNRQVYGQFFEAINQYDSRTQIILHKIIEAHGGIDLYRSAKTMSVKFRVVGNLFESMGSVGISKILRKGANAKVDIDTGQIIVAPFRSENQRAVLDEKQDTISIEEFDSVGNRWVTIEERNNPRKFAYDSLVSIDDLTIAYFGLYTIKHYLESPYDFLRPGVKVEYARYLYGSDDPIFGGYKLTVVYPPDVRSHSRRETYYYSEDGLLTDQFYKPEIFGYLARLGIEQGHNQTDPNDYKDFDGFNFPTVRRAFLNPNGPLAIGTLMLLGPLAIPIQNSFFSGPIIEMHTDDIKLLRR